MFSLNTHKKKYRKPSRIIIILNQVEVLQKKVQENLMSIMLNLYCKMKCGNKEERLEYSMENCAKMNWHKNKDVLEHRKKEIKKNSSIILLVMKLRFEVKL